LQLKANLRVISLIPSATDLLVSLNVDKKLVGVSTYCFVNKRICNLPKIGTALSFDWEQMISLNPGLVMIDKYTSNKDIKNFKKLNIKIMMVKHESIKDIQDSILKIGKVFNINKKARNLHNNFKQKLNSFKNKLINKKIIFNLSERSSSKSINSSLVIGTNTFYHDIIKILGAKNIVKTSGYKSFDIETLMSLKPDIVYCIREKSNLSKHTKDLWTQLYPNAKIRVITSKEAFIPSIHIVKFIKELI